MYNVRVSVPDKDSVVLSFDKPIKAYELLDMVNGEYPLFSCCINGYMENMGFVIDSDCRVDFFDIRQSYANMVMQESLTYLYINCIKEVLGDVKVRIENSLSKGIYTVIKANNINNEVLDKISDLMKDKIKKNIALEEKYMSRKECLTYLRKKNNDEYNLFKSSADLSGAYLVRMDDYEAIAYYHLVPFTKMMSDFELRKYRNGVLLRFPHPSNPSVISDYSEQKLLYEAFSEEANWEGLLGVNYAYDLNKCVLNNNYKELIQISEALHEKKIASIAEMIKASGKRIVLIAGPSSSGKTSFAKRLCIQLKVSGLKTLYLGTDDYFVDRDQLVYDENGERDFESLNAVDVELFTRQMNDLLDGKVVDIPEFNFLTGVKEYGHRVQSINNKTVIVIEGIHGLNPKLTLGIDDSEKFKIYISPLTQLNIDVHHRIPTTDARMLRRIVRDYRTRNRTAQQTINDWPSVRRGEEKNIFPYNSEADVFFNSQCVYELAVLKKYVEPLLKKIDDSSDEFVEAQRLLEFLSYFVSIEDDSMIANNSLVREFIGGSILVK